MTMLVRFDKGLREELTPQERHALALESGPMGRIAIKQRAIIALCDGVLRDDPERRDRGPQHQRATVVRLNSHENHLGVHGDAA
jgi:hypothetical protein